MLRVMITYRLTICKIFSRVLISILLFPFAVRAALSSHTKGRFSAHYLCYCNTAHRAVQEEKTFRTKSARFVFHKAGGRG